MIYYAKKINYWLCIFWLFVTTIHMIAHNTSEVEQSAIRMSYCGVMYFLLKDMEECGTVEQDQKPRNDNVN